MNKIIPFTKVINLNDSFDEIKKIALDNSLKLDDPFTVKGDLVIYGSYLKDDEEFEYSKAIPVEIAIDSKYDTSKCNIKVDDFYYEIINNQNIRVKIDLLLDDLFYKEVKEEMEKLELVDNRNNFDNDLLDDNKLINELLNENDLQDIDLTKNKKMTDFEEKIDNLVNNDEVKDYSVYCVYVISEGDSLETIQEKYNVSKDDLLAFNDLDNLTVGKKIIIPSIDE